MATLAKIAGVHPTHLARTFRRLHGCTVGDYVRWLRLEKAKGALSATEKSVALVAVESGFYDQAHFCRLFKAAYGMTPSEYRASRSG